MTIDQLRRTEQIQPHHWLAAMWFIDQVLTGGANLKIIAIRCRELDTISSRYKIDSYQLLHRAVVSRATLDDKESVLGVLREALNMVHRVMKNETLYF
jgi:hypothetical protein